MRFGAVAIGRNEGDRLKRCLKSLSQADVVVYVDSGSTDGSAEWARGAGANVVELDMSQPFTAARARNAGFERLRVLAPELEYVQFIDADCELNADWPETAARFLDTDSSIAAVCGRRRERDPERSIYNWLCDQEWDGPVGDVRACGGDVMMRVVAMEAVGGFRDDLIAGEEPELCVRLRHRGWHIWRLEQEMTLHDAAMLRFSQWWQRAARGGYAFAQGADLHGEPPERHFVWESRRAWLWGVWLLCACLIIGLTFGPWGWLAFAIYPLQVIRQTVRNNGSPTNRIILATFHMLARFAEGWGQIQFMYNHWSGRQARLIEYK